MSSCDISFDLKTSLAAGERFHLVVAQSDSFALATTSALPPLRAGGVLKSDKAEFRVLSCGWLPGKNGLASSRFVLLETKEVCEAGQYACSVIRAGYSLAWVTLSDKGAAGKRMDESGPLIGELVGEKLNLANVQGFIIPDETDQLKALLVDLALGQGFDLILTTGGTGVGPRDVTPEATLAVIEKRLPGFERAMTAASLAKTPHGAISRAVAGTLGQAVIVNMPGSPKAVAECLEPLLPTFKHTLEKLQGDPSDCAVLNK